MKIPTVLVRGKFNCISLLEDVGAECWPSDSRIAVDRSDMLSCVEEMHVTSWTSQQKPGGVSMEGLCV